MIWRCLAVGVSGNRTSNVSVGSNGRRLGRILGRSASERSSARMETFQSLRVCAGVSW